MQCSLAIGPATWLARALCVLSWDDGSVRGNTWAGIGGVATCWLSAVARSKTVIESGNDARHVVCRETVVPCRTS